MRELFLGMVKTLADLAAETHETVVLAVLGEQKKTIRALQNFGGGKG